MNKLNLVVNNTPTFNGSLVMHDGELCMSSLDIAAYTGKNHFDVMRDIRNMFDKIGESKIACSYKSAQNKELPMYYLNEDDAITLVAGYDVVMRRTIVQEWNRLKKENYSIGKPLHEMDEEELIEYSLKQVREKKRLIQEKKQLEIENKQKEQIIVEQDFIQSEFMETFGGYSSERYKNSYSMNEFAKIVGCNPIKMNNFLRDQGVFMKKITNRLVPMQRYADKFETIPGQYQQGNARIKLSCVDWLYEFLLKREYANPRNAPAEYKDIAKKYLPAIPESLDELM